MKYTSTRNGSIVTSFEDAICSGYAPDGGLFVPECLPPITTTHLQNWSALTYPELSQTILRLFIAPDEVPEHALQNICTSAFEGFENPAHAVPVIQVGSIFVAELFHGPTFCFKDLGMRTVVNLLSYFSQKRQRSITLLVSTTGDTGPAAVRAVSDIGNPLLTILVHYPEGQISEFQRKQLTTVDSSCVRVAAFQGGGDDMDRPIKNLLSQQSYTDSNTLLTGVNSYNIGRPLMQMVHYVWTYLRVLEQLGKIPGDPDVKLDIVLPTGAMGNLAGGYMAKKMGLPLGKLNAGVNANDITHRVVQTGEFYKSETMLKTLSDAINIQVPYNFERLLFYLTKGQHDLVRAWMTTMDATNRLNLDREWLTVLQRDFNSARVSDEEMCTTIRSTQEQFGYLVDPHTAIAIGAAQKLGCGLDRVTTVHPTVILATASPCKFEESVTAAITGAGWAAYLQNGFPAAARGITELPERSPIVYLAKAGGTLSSWQAEWEERARAIVADLGAANGYRCVTQSK